MKKKKIYTGYAVMSEDFQGISFQDFSLETCKRFCRPGYVIVKTMRGIMGFEVRVCWFDYYKPFEWRRGHGNIFYLHLNFNKVFHDIYTRDVVWKPDNKEKQV